MLVREYLTIVNLSVESEKYDTYTFTLQLA